MSPEREMKTPLRMGLDFDVEAPPRTGEDLVQIDDSVAEDGGWGARVGPVLVS